MNPISYIKKNGVKHTWNVFYQYKIDLIIQKAMRPFLENKPLQDIIMIESHNDFDCNGGAFYDYLIKEGYNKKYKIVWLLKNPKLAPKRLPENVEWVPLFKPSIKKDYYIWIAKFFTADNTTSEKKRADQKSFFLTHSAGGLKSVKGKVIIPSSVDYVLFQSETYATIQAEQYSLDYPSERIITIGYPSHDVLHSTDKTELKKISSKAYAKTILWMPTFRKNKDGIRNDSNLEYPLGVPLFSSTDEYVALNQFLQKRNILLIIKLHPMQDLDVLKIRSISNIVVLTGEDVKKLEIDNYRLMPCTDALISDYSAAAYEYLQVDKPIAYVLSDMADYKLGFVVEDLDKLIAGAKIFTFDDLKFFIEDVANDVDRYAKKRASVRDFIYTYNDNNNCKRLAEFMNL